MRSPLQWIRQHSRNSPPRFKTASGRSRHPIRRLQVEGLESRCLLSVNFKLFPVPTFQSDPLDITAGLNGKFFEGNLWFTESGGNKIGEITPAGAITEFKTPATGGSPRGITRGPDGNLWFTDLITGAIGRITPAGAFTAINTPVGSALTTGPDGNIWYTIYAFDAIGELNSSTLRVTSFTLPTAGASPQAITTGPDGNLWFAEAGANQIGQIDPMTHIIREFPIPTRDSDPSGITTGPDGNLWFTEALSNKIGRITTTGVITEFSAPSANGSPVGITAGPNGTLFFTDAFADAIGEINPTNGQITEFTLPPGGGRPRALTLGSDGNVWFTEDGNDVIGELVLTTAPPTAPDLALSGNAPTTLALGSNLTYHLTVTNNGTAGATGVNLTDTLPSGVTFVSATGGIQPVNGLLTFALGSLAPGASTSVTIVVTPTAVGDLIDRADAGMNQADPTPADNSLSLPTTVSTIAAPADLALSASAPGTVTLGNTVTYVLTVTNDGTGDATGVTLTDTLPGGVTFISASGGVTPVHGVLTFRIGNLAAGAHASFTIVVTPTTAGTLNDQASVSGDQTDPTPADNSITQITTVAQPPRLDGPTVTSVQQRVSHGRPKGLVLAFNKPLNPTKAQILGNYQIVPLGGKKRAIRIKAALYNATTQTVTLTLAQRLKRNRRFQLTVVGTGPSGLTDLSGNLLDGQKSGDPGSNFVMIASAADLTLTTTN